MSNETRQPIGAWASIEWIDKTGYEVPELAYETVYYSFSQMEDDAETDRHGVPDEHIFYYAPEGEAELIKNDFKEWVVHGYDLVYDKEEV